MAVFNLNLIETTFFTHNMIHEFKHDTLMIAQSSVRLLIFKRAAICSIASSKGINRNTVS